MTPDQIYQEAIIEAQRVGAALGVPWQIIFGQWGYESYSNGEMFGSGLAMSNLNLAGIKRFYSGGWAWRDYGTVRAFADDYLQIIQREYPNVPGTQTPEDFARALTQHKGGGSWFGHTDYGSYAAGIKARIAQADLPAIGKKAFSADDVIYKDTTISPKPMTLLDRIRAKWAEITGASEVHNFPTPEEELAARKAAAAKAAAQGQTMGPEWEQKTQALQDWKDYQDSTNPIHKIATSLQGFVDSMKALPLYLLGGFFVIAGLALVALDLRPVPILNPNQTIKEGD